MRATTCDFANRKPVPHGYRLAFGPGGNRSWPDAIGRQGSWDVRDGVKLLPPVGARWLCTKLLRQPYRGRRSIVPCPTRTRTEPTTPSTRSGCWRPPFRPPSGRPSLTYASSSRLYLERPQRNYLTDDGRDDAQQGDRHIACAYCPGFFTPSPQLVIGVTPCPRLRFANLASEFGVAQ